jgi:hypothetical protein
MALQEKISRERVGIEVSKMLQGEFNRFVASSFLTD